MNTIIKKTLFAPAVAFCAIAAGFTTQLQAARAPKVEVCHIPPGNPENRHTISVSKNAVDAHLRHGDKLTACCFANSECDDGDRCLIDTCDIVCKHAA